MDLDAVHIRMADGPLIEHRRRSYAAHQDEGGRGVFRRLDCGRRYCSSCSLSAYSTTDRPLLAGCESPTIAPSPIVPQSTCPSGWPTDTGSVSNHSRGNCG